MSIATERTKAGRDYAAAHAAQYTDHDLPTAPQLYLKVISAHVGTEEAGDARSQVQNIITATVPDQELLDAQVKLAVVRFAQCGDAAGEDRAVHHGDR